MSKTASSKKHSSETHALKTSSIGSTLAAFTLACATSVGCSGASFGDATMFASENAEDVAREAVNQSANQTRFAASFIQVEGADLNAKLEAAERAARASSQKSPYWTAYSFDVRPGVAVDPVGGEFHGTMDNVGGVAVFIGSTSSGMTAETRNLAVFILREPSTGNVTRMEIYNLDREREYGGYPVYWAGRAGNSESLAHLRSLAEGASVARLQERAALAIALHDDRGVGDVLKSLIRTSQNREVRSTAIFWIGQAGGETELLANIVRDDKESPQIRRSAARAIGASRDSAALKTLLALYNSAVLREVKRGILHAVSENESREEAYAFVVKVAKTDADRDARRAAVHILGESGREAAVDELMSIFNAEQDGNVRRSVMHALSEHESPRAGAKLLELARGATDADLRRHAIHLIGEKGEEFLDELIRLFDAERNAEVRRQMLRSFSEMENQRAEDKLFEVARRADSSELRRQAIRSLGERASRRSLDFLRETASAEDEDAQVQMQAVRAISERPVEQAVPALIQIAKTHPNAHVRRAAMHSLSETNDPRAVEFFREVLSK